MHKIYSRQNIEISRHHRSLWHRTAMHWETKRALTNACLAWRSAEAPARFNIQELASKFEEIRKPERLKQDEHIWNKMKLCFSCQCGLVRLILTTKGIGLLKVCMNSCHNSCILTQQKSAEIRIPKKLTSCEIISWTVANTRNFYRQGIPLQFK